MIVLKRFLVIDSGQNGVAMENCKALPGVRKFDSTLVLQFRERQVWHFYTFILERWKKDETWTI